MEFMAGIIVVRNINYPQLHSNKKAAESQEPAKEKLICEKTLCDMPKSIRAQAHEAGFAAPPSKEKSPPNGELFFVFGLDRGIYSFP